MKVASARVARGAALAKAREAKGLSQAEIARILDVSPGTVGDWEVGTHGIRQDRLREVAKAYGVNVAELV